MQQHPAVRAQRILYPAAAWALSLGRGSAVPWTLVAVNLLALAAMGGVALRMAAGAGVPRALGLLVPFYPGFLLSLCRDTAEILATALALAALLMAGERRWPAAALLASAAVLTRETTLPYLAGYGLVALWRTARRRSFDPRVGWCLIPLVVYLGWQAVLKLIWGSFSYEVIGHDDFAAWPLVDFGRAVLGYGRAMMVPPPRYRLIFGLASCVAVATFVAGVGWRLASRRRVPAAILIPCGLYAAMAAFFAEAIWRDPWGYVRILCDLYILGIVALLASRDRVALRRLVPAVGVLWLATAAFLF